MFPNREHFLQNKPNRKKESAKTNRCVRAVQLTFNQTLLFGSRLMNKGRNVLDHFRCHVTRSFILVE